MFFKIVVFKKLAIFTKACNFIKMRLQIFKKFFYRTPLVAASQEAQKD